MSKSTLRNPVSTTKGDVIWPRGAWTRKALPCTRYWAGRLFQPRQRSGQGPSGKMGKLAEEGTFDLQAMQPVELQSNRHFARFVWQTVATGSLASSGTRSGQ